MANPSLRTKDKNVSTTDKRVNPLTLLQNSSTDIEKSINCRECRQPVTRPSLAIDSKGKRFTNPLGIQYHIVCYKDAPGASEIGIPTAEFSWFPNYAWSFAHCIKCHAHLGWWFSGADRFIGLITARVVLAG